MKTTINLPAALLEEAKRVASREGTTLRALVEEGLRRVLAARPRRRRFRLRDGSVDGSGVLPGVQQGSWARIRDLAYEGRGS